MPLLLLVAHTSRNTLCRCQGHWALCVAHNISLCRELHGSSWRILVAQDMAKVYSSSHGAARLGRPRRPRLFAALAAWAFLAFVVCLQRSSSAVHNCQRASAAAHDAAAAGAADATVAAGLAARPHGGSDVLPQPAVVDRWPALQGLSRERIEQLIRAPAQLHGRVQKGGLPANYM